MQRLGGSDFQEWRGVGVWKTRVSPVLSLVFRRFWSLFIPWVDMVLGRHGVGPIVLLSFAVCFCMNFRF